MAYAALVSLEQTIHQILNHALVYLYRYPTWHERCVIKTFRKTSDQIRKNADPIRCSTFQENYDIFFSIKEEKDHISTLHKYVISFQDFLEGFPDKAKRFEAQIRDAATAAEDIIECFMLDQIQLDRRRRRLIHNINGPDRIRLGCKLKQVSKEMKAIAADVVEIKTSDVIKDAKLGDSSTASSSSSVLNSGKIDMVGFEDDLLEIKDRLAGRSPQLQYLAICGMGGIGKTTLARNAYEDKLILEHFDIRAWVTISQDYRAREILLCLLDSMKEFNREGVPEGSVAEMADRIHKILYGRRYLIVMDDIWSTEVLDDVRHFFPDDCNGSRIMLTTRLSDVAAYADPSPYEMPLMDENKSWDLLKQKVLSNRSKAILSDEVDMIGHEIARRCRGLPLALVVIAGILSSISETTASWAEVAKNIKKATSKDERMEEIVSLGYNHLPHRLRPCLIYMGLLPEDHSIRVSLLVKLWIAEGFLKHPKDSSKSLEADAEEYLEDLARRNLILVIERKYNGRLKRCGLHDMVRETCIRLLDEEKHLRHVTTNYYQGCTSKRSLLRFSNDDMLCPYFLKSFRLLRVMHVPKLKYNSSKMLKLYHLRHLCFIRYERYLPADLSDFHRLQSLIITCVMAIQLSPSIWKLRKLRHLIVSRVYLPDSKATYALKNLQTLKNVVFDEMNMAYKSLKRFPNLIKLGLVLDSNYNEPRLNKSLVCLRQLEELNIRLGVTNHLSPVFPESLKKLTLENCRASVSFLEAIGSLPNLQMLKLWGCRFDDSTWEVRGGEFPKLKMLQFRELRDITTLNIVEDSSTAFPMLSCLRIDRCYDLEELSDEIGDIPTLQLIQVFRSGRGVCDWARRVEESQQDLGNDTLQVKIIKPFPSIYAQKHGRRRRVEDSQQDLGNDTLQVNIDYSM